MASVKALGAAFIAELDALCQRNLVPHLPAALAQFAKAWPGIRVELEEHVSSEVAQAVADYLTAVGVICEVETMEYSTVRRSFLQKGRFDAVLWSRSFGPDPECSIVWSSKGPLNFCRLRSKEVDGLIASARVAVDKPEPSSRM